MPGRHGNPMAPDFPPGGGAQGRDARDYTSFSSEAHGADGSFLGNSVHSLSQALRTYDVESLDNSRNVPDGDGVNYSHRYSVGSSVSAYDASRAQDGDVNVRLEASPGNRRGRSAGRGRDTDSEFSYHTLNDPRLNNSTQKVFMNFVNSSFSAKHDGGSQPPPTPRVVHNTSFSKANTNNTNNSNNNNHNNSFGMMPGSMSILSGATPLQNNPNGNVRNESFSRWSKSLSADESQATLTASLRRHGTTLSHSSVPLIKPHMHRTHSKDGGRGHKMRTKLETSITGKSDMSRTPSLQEPIPFPFFIEKLRERMKFNDGLQDIVAFTLFAISMCFFATYHPSTIERMYYASASVFEHFGQKEFPSPQRQIDAYRQRAYFFNTTSWVSPDKYYLEISNHLDWRWYITDVLMESFLVPFQVVGNLTGLNESTTTIGEGYGQMYGMYPVGALRIRTIRMADFTCQLQESLYPTVEDDPDFPRDCWRAGTNRKYEAKNATLCPAITNPLNRSESLFQYKEPTAQFGSETVGVDDRYHDGGYYFDIPFSINATMLKEYQKAFNDLSCHFVDNWATRFAAFCVFFYAPATDTWHRVRYRSEVKVTGWHLNAATQRPFEVYSSRMTGQVVYTCFVLLMFAIYCGTLIYQGVYMFKVDRKVLRKRVRSLTFYIDFFLVITTVVVFIFWFRWMNASVQIKDKLHFPFNDTSLSSHLEGIQTNYEVFNLTCAIDLLIIALRLVRIYELWAPLLTITQSILSDSSTKTLVWIGLIYIITFFGFSLGGWVMFGCYCESFETLSSSFMFLLQMVYFGFNSSYPLIAGNEGAFFCFMLAYFIVGAMMITYSITAMLSWSFTRINSKYFIAYDLDWFGRCIRSMWKKLRWYRIHRFLRVLFGMQRETQYLNEICDVLENYVQERLGQDTRKSLIHLSASYPLTMNTTSAAATGANTPPPMSAAAAADKDDHDENQPLLETSTNTTPTAAAAAAEAAAAAMAELREELADSDYTFKRLSIQSYKITFEQLLQLVPPRLYSHCGGIVFFTDLWRETVESLLDFKRTPEQLEIAARRACTKDLTMKVMKQELLKIEKLNTTIYHLETHVANLRSALQVHNMSFVDDDE